jgi:hypothetical protein
MSINRKLKRSEGKQMRHDDQWKLVCEPAFKRIEDRQIEVKKNLEEQQAKAEQQTLERHAEITKTISDGIKAVTEGVERLERVVYKDNGSKSIQTRLNDHERAIKLVTWIGSLILGAAILGFLGYVFLDVFQPKALTTTKAVVSP